MAIELCANGWLKSHIRKTLKARNRQRNTWEREVCKFQSRTEKGTKKNPELSDLWKTKTRQRCNLFQHFQSNISSFSHSSWVKIVHKPSFSLVVGFPSLHITILMQSFVFLCFLCQICLGIIDVALSQEGFCSAPSILKTDSNSQSLYWKVINPTLSPSHLQGLWSRLDFLELLMYQNKWN